MGITGVNFASPDGTLVLLENESNLRFTATLPKVHLALMGLEKIIPILTDLEVMLRLLPASATGQRLTALVHFIRGLKVQPQGNQAFYLVILDNGRRRLAADPNMAEALFCLRCGACLNVCPIFQVGAAHLYGRVYPGAIGILLAPYLAPTGDICDLCTQCGACQEICPAGIRLAEKIQVLRSYSRRFRELRVLSTGAGSVLSRPRWYRGLEPAWRGLASLAARQGCGGLPVFSPKSFHRQQRGRRPVVDSPESCSERPSLMPVGEPRGRPPSGVESGPEMHNAGEALGASIARLAHRLQEAKSSLEEIAEPAALAQRLAVAPAPLWLEDHPWLRQVAAELQGLGVQHRVVQGDWSPEVGTAVTVGLGAIPETGSILVDSGRGAASVLPFRAGKHIILVPRNRVDMSLSRALAWVQSREPGMVSWLTGPSRTADIEKVLVLGAQGPKSVEIILYLEEN
jgi:L-lactate utilization protein LutC/ferredoxin